MSTPSLNAMQSLAGKVAVVTGAGRGMGACIAQRLCEAGASVVATDYMLDNLENVVAQIRASGGNIVALRADASSQADAELAMQTAEKEFGGVDILVNNAGLFPPSPVLEITEELWDRVHDVNLRGLFFYAQTAAKHFIAQNAKEQGRGGCIVNIASTSGFWPSGYLAHYDATKGGVVMVTKSLAKELGLHGIRVNAVAPGAVATPGGIETSAKMMAAQGVPASAEIPAQSVLGHNADADDIARAVYFLSTDLARSITGVTLQVDAGMLLT
jgi:glucose 1-dehydrogenase/2-deoxy-D-gluconate 3-dehydrogenase